MTRPPVHPPLQAVFLDRDGTLIKHVPYLRHAADVALLPGVREALARARSDGVKLFLLTNQSGVGRGMFTLAEVEACNARMIELLELGPQPFDSVCTAAIVPDPLTAKESHRRLALGIDAFVTVLDWFLHVTGMPCLAYESASAATCHP